MVVQRDDFQRGVAVDHGDFAVAHVDEILGVFDDRRGVGREEELPVAHAHDHRAALPRGDDPVVVALLDDGDGVGADHLPEGTASGSEQPLVARTYSIRFTNTSESVLLRKVYPFCSRASFSTR